MVNFTGVYVDPDNPSNKHIISFLDNHLVYNTDNIDWDMRFFPTSSNTFQAIRQGGVDGVMKFSTQPNGELMLEMTQYKQLIGKGKRQ